MRNKVTVAILLLPALLSAQERFTVKGRVINEQGEAVEYVQIGIPKRETGTISTADGSFEIEVPRDTLEFFHVSYQPASYYVTSASDDVTIVLHEQELQPAVFIGGDTKEKYLVRPGSNVLKNIGVVSFALRSENPLGREHREHRGDIGRYFISFQIVGYDEQAFKEYLSKPEEDRKFWEMTMDFRIFLKSSYLREVALGKMEHFPINIGIAVKGLEFEDAQ